MKAYNETLLRNEYALTLAKRLRNEGLLDENQYVEIQKHHADVPYSPNIFIKILLFGFGCIGFGFGSSLTAMAFLGESIWGFSIVSMLYGISALFGLFFFIKDRKFHFSGIDNALIYCILGSFLPILFQLYEIAKLQEIWIGALLFLPILLAACYSFGEPLVALGTFFNVLFIVASLLMKNPLGKALLPFALMLLSGVTYWTFRKFSQKTTSFYWQTALYWVSTAALAVFYAAGNYFVVREANAALNGLPNPAPEIAFAQIFWGLTFLIPALYLYGGFRWRDRTLLTLGLMALVCSILTVRYYHAVLPVEWGLLLGGIATTLIAYGVIRQLKVPKYGFSAASDTSDNDVFRLETALLSHVTKGIQSADHGVKLGGGDFGGGGAGEKY
jgi:hypothetical protein